MINKSEATQRWFNNYWGNVGQLAPLTKRPYGAAEAQFAGLDYDSIQRGRVATGVVQKGAMFLPKSFYSCLVDILCHNSPFLKGMWMKCLPKYYQKCLVSKHYKRATICATGCFK
jgi:hypothetical protein